MKTKITIGFLAVIIAITCPAARINPVTGMGEGTSWEHFSSEIAKNPTKLATFVTALELASLGVTPGSAATDFLVTPSSANLRTFVSDESGTGALVFANTPTLVTPVIGAATGTSLALGADPADAGVIRLANAAVIGWEADVAGTDVTLTVNSSEQFVFSAAILSPTLVTPALGTPASGVMTNATGTAAGLTAGLATDTVTKTGTGSTYVTNTSPTLVTPILGVAAATSVSATGALVSTGTAGIGYATGAGGTETQITSRTTTVVLNKITGQITSTADSMAALTPTTFTITNSTVAATDVIVCSKVSGDVDTVVTVNSVGAGSFTVTLYNRHASDADTTAFVFNFAVIKGVTS